MACKTAAEESIQGRSAQETPQHTTRLSEAETTFTQFLRRGRELGKCEANQSNRKRREAVGAYILYEKMEQLLPHVSWSTPEIKDIQGTTEEVSMQF